VKLERRKKMSFFKRKERNGLSEERG